MSRDRLYTWAGLWRSPSSSWEALRLEDDQAESQLRAPDERSGLPYQLDYRLRWDADWHLREAVFHVESETGVRKLHLLADGRGHWQDGDGAGDQRRIAGRQRLLDDAPGVAVLPGYSHRQLPSGLALRRDRGTNLFVARLLAMQDQQNLVLVHRTEPLVVALSLPIDRVSGTEVRRPVQAG